MRIAAHTVIVATGAISLIGSALATEMTGADIKTLLSGNTAYVESASVKVGSGVIYWNADGTWAQQLGWTKPRAGAESTAVQSSVSETEKVQQLEAEIAAVRQTVEERLAAEQQTVEQLAARQDQWVSEITKLQAATSKSLRRSQRILQRVTAQQRNVDLRHVK